MEETTIAAGVAERLSKLGLQREPFIGAGSENIYFADAQSRQRLDLLYHLAPYSQLLLVTGEHGAGKSALMRKLVSRSSEMWRVCIIPAAAEMDDRSLLREVRAGFGMPEDPPDAETGFRTLLDHLQGLRFNSQTPLLIIDNAERLSVEALRLVQRICDAGASSIAAGIILVGDAGLERKLAQPELEPLRGYIAHRFEVLPFNEEDSAAYIHFRMSAAGFAGETPFTPAVIKRIYKGSRGVPAKINELAHEVLVDELVKRTDLPRVGPRPARQRQMSQTRWALIGVGVAAIGLVLWWQGRGGATQVPRDNVVSVTTPADPAPAAVQSRAPEPAPLPAEAAARPPAPPPETVPVQPPPVAEAPPAAASAPSAASEQPAPPPAAKLDASAAGASKSPVPGKAAASPAGTPKRNAPAEMANAEASRQPRAATSVLRAGDGTVQGSDYLAKQNPADYTLQLAAMKTEDEVRDFVARHGIAGGSAYFPVRKDGRILYAVVYGTYPSRTAAEAAAKDLPKGLKMQPWVRSYKSVQGAMVTP